MAGRFSAKLLQRHLGYHPHHRQFPRILNSAPATVPVSSCAVVEKPVSLPEPEYEPDPVFTRSDPNPVLDLEDAQKLFSSLSTAKLVKSTVNLKMVATDPIVDMGMWVMKSKLLDIPVARQIILGVTKRTFYEQFVAGEDTTETGRTIRKMWDVGLRGMLAYGSEHADDNAACDKNFEAFMATVESTKTLPPSSVSFMIAKISAIYPIALLERMSGLLRWEKKHPSSISLPWKQRTLPIFSPSTPMYHTRHQPEPLTPAEEADLKLGNERLMRLCQRCTELGVPIAVDAEETHVQPAIDYLTYSSAISFNSGKKPVVFGTIQAYLKDSKERLALAMEAAEKMGLPMGFKLVRGAYMSFESRLAGSLGFESPVHKTIQRTHDCYNECAAYMIDKAARGTGAVVLATHNVDSGRMAATTARSLGIGKENDRVQFAQLYGMSDALTYGLNNAGFNVSKYLTFGPVEEVIPFLLRRAEENRGVLSSSTLDRTLMWKEVKRRMKIQG